MNADPTDTTRSPHLELDELIAEANGQPAGSAAREHLASCAQCRLEADRWGVVADGVRSLADAADLGAESELGPADAAERERGLAATAGQEIPSAAAASAALPAHAAAVGEPHRGRPWTWRRTRWAAGSAAAALLLLVGVSEATGMLHVSVGAGSGGSVTTTTTFATVSGCTQLQQADGTLEQVNGDDLVVQTTGGQTVTVATSATTFMSESGFAGPAGSLAREITDGAQVEVRGPRADGAIDAVIVTVGQPFKKVNVPRFVPVDGTVADAGASGFTLVTSSGTRIQVTTSASTLVVVPHARPGQLRAGAAIFAIGSARSNGTMSARAVAAVTQFSSGQAQLSMHTSVKDCSPASVDHAILALAVGA